MKLAMLGTGNALVTECYNTCFVLFDEHADRADSKYFLVDGGGGNEILHKLKQAQIDLQDIHTIFVTHKHIDHLIGIIWLIRMICQSVNKGSYIGNATIYAHDEVTSLLYEMADKLLQKKQTELIGKRLFLVPVQDGEEKTILNRTVTFFDIHSAKAKQFGFCMELGDGKRLTCCGDEPYNPCEERYAKNSSWLLHEAFCLHSQADIFSPYEKHHSTVKDACELAQKLSVENLLLYHTEDKNIANRKELYTNEGKAYFKGNIFVPDDLETITL